jgi:hypothetical protein
MKDQPCHPFQHYCVYVASRIPVILIRITAFAQSSILAGLLHLFVKSIQSSARDPVM